MKKLLVLLLFLIGCQAKYQEIESDGVSFYFPENVHPDLTKVIIQNLEGTLSVEVISENIRPFEKVKVDSSNGKFIYYLAYKNPPELKGEQVAYYELLAESAGDIIFDAPVDIYLTDSDFNVVRYIPYNPRQIGETTINLGNEGQLILSPSISTRKGLDAFNYLKPHIKTSDSSIVNFEITDKRVFIKMRNFEESLVSKTKPDSLIQAARYLEESVFDLPVTIVFGTKTDSIAAEFKSN